MVTVDNGGISSVQLDVSGVATFYLCGVGMLVESGWGLLLTLLCWRLYEGYLVGPYRQFRVLGKDQRTV